MEKENGDNSSEFDFIECLEDTLSDNDASPLVFQELVCERRKRMVTQTELFALDIEHKREYSRLSSKRNRAKQREEKEYLLNRNEFLTCEQRALRTKISKLRDELGEVSRNTFRNIQAKEIIENQILKSQLMKPRILVNEVNSLLQKISHNDDKEIIHSKINSRDDENREILHHLSREGALETLDECMSLWDQSLSLPKINLLEQEIVANSLQKLKYFSNLQKILVSSQIENENLVFRIDVSGVAISKEILTKACLRSFSSVAQDSVFWEVKRTHSEAGNLVGGEFDVDQLDLSSLSLSETNELNSTKNNIDLDGWHDLGDNVRLIVHQVNDKSAHGDESTLSVSYFFPKRDLNHNNHKIEAAIFSDALFCSDISLALRGSESIKLQKAVVRGMAVYCCEDSDVKSNMSLVGRVSLKRSTDTVVSRATRTWLKLCGLPSDFEIEHDSSNTWLPHEYERDGKMLHLILSAIDVIIDNHISKFSHLKNGNLMK